MDQQAVKCCRLSGLDFPDDFRKCAPILQNTQQQFFFFNENNLLPVGLFTR